MNRFVPLEKMSKKAQKEQARRKRGTWGEINPVTRRTENKRRYNRKRIRQEDRNLHVESFFIGIKA